MEKLEKLYEGKAKKLYATDDPDVLWVEYMNQPLRATARRRPRSKARAR